MARLLAENLAETLASEFDVDAVYCFGSLVEDGGEDFGESSDVDLLVRGLEASTLFRAQSVLEMDVVEKSDSPTALSFDLVRTEDVGLDPETLVANDEAVRLPMAHE